MARKTDDGKLWWKVDFHLHSAEDPYDAIEHDAPELLRRARDLGFDALAITLHRHVLLRPEISALAESLGLRLFPSIEFRLGGADVVAVNVTPEEAKGVRTFDDLRALRAARGKDLLVFAPHPFYVLGGSIGDRIHGEIGCFDAVEYSHFHTAWLNPNRRAVAVAERYGKPLLATSDAHRLDCFGEHYSWVQVPENPDAVELFDAIRAGRIERVSPPWRTRKFFGYLAHIFFREPLRVAMRKWQGSR